MSRPIVPVPVHTVEQGNQVGRLDLLAVEEPLEIRLNGEAVSITMRTPGQDLELAAGFLFAEGLAASRDQITMHQSRPNVVDMQVAGAGGPDLGRLRRNFYTTSSCGVCGKASLEALELAGCPMLPAASASIDSEVLYQLPEALRRTQMVFDHTGGLHAAALFDFEGNLLGAREDVGRHNAVDKLIGCEFLGGRIREAERLLLVSGRVSFEIVQKALMAGIPVLAAVGAPSSLAVEVALRFRLTLIGFLRNHRFNVYSGHGRLQPRQETAQS
jgi:FdhD protein